uniref:Centrobin-like n=1 Tax=Saccoglossus kowalevskii TaxID=10224 RepID=A0ABM0MLJ7_SACKO
MFMEKLKEERESVEKTNNKQQTMLRKLETELAQAVEQLAKEQLRATKAESEKDRHISKQSKERAETLKILESERKRVEKLEVERTEAVKKNKRMEKEVDELQKMMEKDRIHWQAMEHELQGKLNRASKEHFNAMDEYKRKLEKETRCSQDAQRVLRSVQTELDSVKMELDTIRTDKENMKMEISLLEAKHEANRTKMESQHKVELEIKIADKVSEIHQKMSEKEAEIRESHRRQVQDINESHQMELEQQRTDAQLEFTKKDAKLKIMTQDYEDSLEENRRVIADLEKKAQKSELHRSELVASLQTLMQSHCNEALSLLGTGSQSVVRKPPYMSTNASILSSGRLSDISLLSEHTINDNNYQSTASPYSDDNIALSTIPEENGSTETRSERSSYSYQEPVQSYSRVSSADTLLQLSGIYSELMKDDNVSSNHQRPSNTRDLSTSFNKNSDKERNVAERDYTETDHHDTGKHQYVERNDCNEYNSSKYGLFGNSFSLPADETVYKRNEYFTGRDGFVGKPEEISERRYQEREPLREEPLYGKKNEYFTGHNGFVEKTEQLNAHVDLHGPQNDEDGSFYPLESQDATLLAADDRNESSDT